MIYRDRSVDRSCEDPLCRVDDHVFAKQVIHKRDGPKLPYQAVVIRQSAMHREGRNATGARGGVNPHTSLGPIPVFMFLRGVDLQAGQDSRQQRTNGNATSMTFRLLLQYIRDDFSFVTACVVGELFNNRFEVGQQLIHGCLMLVMKLPQFFQNRIRLPETGMLHRLVASNAGQGETAKSLGNLDTAGSLINAARFVNVRLATVVMAMQGQVVSDPHQRAPQASIGLTDDRPSVLVRLIALIT